MKSKKKRYIQEISAGELQKFTYDLLEVCAFDSVL